MATPGSGMPGRVPGDISASLGSQRGAPASTQAERLRCESSPRAGGGRRGESLLCSRGMLTRSLHLLQPAGIVTSCSSLGDSPHWPPPASPGHASRLTSASTSCPHSHCPRSSAPCPPPPDSSWEQGPLLPSPRSPRGLHFLLLHQHGTAATSLPPSSLSDPVSLQATLSAPSFLVAFFSPLCSALASRF